MRPRSSGALHRALATPDIAGAGCESNATKQKLAQLTTVSAEKDSLLALMGGLSGLGWAALFIISVRDSVRGLLPQIPISPASAAR